ncbi:phosphatidylinositol glycan, class O, partial [Paragonimus westermani]
FARKLKKQENIFMPHVKIASRFKFVASKVTVLCGISLGLVTFACGFFLNRSELPYVSTRLSNVAYVPAYRRLVVLLVDGLAFNFVRRDSDIYPADLPSNLRFTSELLRTTKAHLVHFVADPPTTTLQRLKGLMTGSMPTFVDAGSNFRSYQLMEDNLIRQWRQANRRILFVGDDTWTGLFPMGFDEADPYHSLNVKDLDTVDKAVYKFVVSSLQNSSHGPHWDVLIGHLLGIDHCGHAYGPAHIEMRRKLRELDEFIRKVVTLLHSDDLLLVLGDHGMTASGDHGGDSYAELDAALLLYSGRGFPQFINNITSRKSSIAQIDLVPTLAALTGVPIPYSNLGVCVDDFLGSRLDVRRALLLNFVQVLNYTLSYHREIGFIPMEPDLEQFVNSLPYSTDADLFTLAQRLENEQLKSRLQQLQAAFRKHWTRFDSGRMWIGLWLMLSGISTLLHFDSCWGKKELVITGQNFVAIYTLLDMGTSFTTSIFGRLLFASVSTLVLYSSLLECSVSFRSHVPLLLAFLHGMSYLSNSFLVHEIRVTCFLLHTSILCYALKRILMIDTFFFTWHTCCIPAALMLGIRLSVVFEVCREESLTSNCRSAVDAWLAKPLTKLTLEEARLTGTSRLFVALGALLFIIVSHQLWLRHLTKGAVKCIFLQCILPLAGFFLAVCWILDIAQVFVMQSSNNLLPATTVLLLIVLSLACNTPSLLGRSGFECPTRSVFRSLIGWCRVMFTNDYK